MQKYLRDVRHQEKNRTFHSPGNKAAGRHLHYQFNDTHLSLFFPLLFHSCSVDQKYLKKKKTFIPTKYHITQALKMQATSKATCELKTTSTV